MSEREKGEGRAESPDDFFLGGAPEDRAEQGSRNAAAAGKKAHIPAKKGSTRMLLLLLLLVAIAAAGFFFFGQESSLPESPVAVVAPETPGKMKIPERAAEPAAAEPVKEEVLPDLKPATPEPEVKVADVPAPAAQAAAPQPVSPPAFALTSGSYLYQGAMHKALAQIEKLGYQVSVSEKPESHEMTRLQVGLYDRPQADKRLEEIKKLSEGAFLAAEEGKFAVYAGSFLSLDKARRTADLLYQQGVRVDERQVKLDLPQTTLRFGGFATRQEAEAVASKLLKLGVKAPQVVSFK